MIENYSAGQWYDIRIETDPVTRILEVYVNKKRVLRDTAISYFGLDAGDIGSWETSTDASESELFLDNIHIYRDVNDEFQKKAIELASVFGDRKNVVNDIILPKITEGYTLVWSSSDNSVISDSGEVTRSDDENLSVKISVQISRDGYTYAHSYLLYVPRRILNGSNVADIVIEERTDHSGRKFFRRGIPFEQGELFEGESIALKYNKMLVPVQTEIIEKYSDGSIKWLSVSFMWNIEANQSYELYVVKEECAASSDVIVYASDSDLVISNGLVQATVTDNGISQLSYNGKTVLGFGGIGLQIDNTFFFKADAIKVISRGPVYAQVRLTGAFSGCGVAGDWFITVYNGDNRLYHEFKFTAKGDRTISSETVNIAFSDEFSSVAYKNNSSSVNGITESDRMTLSKDGLSVILTSKDVTRFKGAISKEGVHNGFVYNENLKLCKFAPIQYETDYFWLDGITRTARLDMSFYDSLPTEDETEREESWAYTSPSLTVSPERFVKAGIIEDNNTSPAITRTENLLTSLYGNLWNHFQAGKLPHSLEINYENEKIITTYRGGRYEDAFDRSGGETEYNLWKAYMNTGNPVLFDVIAESSEYWTDFMVYRGKIPEIQGTNRYMTKDTDLIAFKTNMPFYGDISGLYMTYCITGDPYYKESFKMAADFWEKSIRDAGGLPILSYWYNNQFPDCLNYNEEFSEEKSFQFRFAGIAKGMYYAYCLLGDEKYLNAGKDIADFLPVIQLENGSFYESYYYPSLEPRKTVTNDDGSYAYSEKFYIMSYGARMLTDFYNMSGYAPMLPVLVNLEDFLKNKRTEDGFCWTPNADDFIYSVPSIRNAGSPSTEMSFVAKLYLATGDKEYLRDIAKMFRNYVSAWNGGNTDRIMETGKSNFMEVSQAISRILLDNYDTVIKMGYADVIAVLDSNAQIRKDLYQDFKTNVLKKRNGRFAMNVFDTNMGRVVYFNNAELTTYTAENPELYKDIAFNMDFKADSDKKLWYGATNTVRESGTHIISDVTVIDVISLLKTDFAVNSTQDVTANITSYTPDRIEITLSSADDIPFSINDGYFNIEDGKRYVLEVNGTRTFLKAENSSVSGIIPTNGAVVNIALYEADAARIRTELLSEEKIIFSPAEATSDTVNIVIYVPDDESYSEYGVAASYENKNLLFDVNVFDVDSENTVSNITLNLPENKAEAIIKVFFFSKDFDIVPTRKPITFQ